MRNFSRFLAAAAGLACAASLAFAAEQAILGKTLLVKNPGDAAKRKVSGQGKEAASPNTIVGNPTTGGGKLEVFLEGASPSKQSFNLPSTGWSASGPNGFKFKGTDAVKSVSIKKTPSGVFSIKAKVFGKNGTVTLVPPNPGTHGCMALTLGTGDRYSVDFGPTSNFGNKNDATIFKAKKPTAQGTCPTSPYGSPSRAFLAPPVDLLD